MCSVTKAQNPSHIFCFSKMAGFNSIAKTPVVRKEEIQRSFIGIKTKSSEKWIWCRYGPFYLIQADWINTCALTIQDPPIARYFLYGFPVGFSMGQDRKSWAGNIRHPNGEGTSLKVHIKHWETANLSVPEPSPPYKPLCCTKVSWELGWTWKGLGVCGSRCWRVRIQPCHLRPTQVLYARSETQPRAHIHMRVR